MKPLGKEPISKLPAAAVREWLETNVDAFWGEGPAAFVGHLVAADDFLIYMDRDVDWAEAHLLLGGAYERVIPFAASIGVPGIPMETVYWEHALQAYKDASNTFMGLGNQGRARVADEGIQRLLEMREGAS